MKRGYRGKRRGMSAEQVMVAAAAILAAVLLLTIHANSQWIGMSAEEQIHHAVFDAKDWE